MPAAGNTEVTSPSLLGCGHTMTQLVELPPAGEGLRPRRDSGPVCGYVLEGRILFELEGGAPREISAGEAFWEPGWDMVHYQVVNLEPAVWSRFLAVCLCDHLQHSG